MLKKHTLMGIKPSTYLVVLHSLKQYSLAELLQAVLIHLNSGYILMLLDIHVSNALKGIDPSTSDCITQSEAIARLAELLQAVLIHLNSGDILMLLDVDMSNVETTRNHGNRNPAPIWLYYRV